jgi:hypothetical protein
MRLELKECGKVAMYDIRELRGFYNELARRE